MMEEEKDNIEEMERKRRRQSLSTVPPDLITEIFLKLPLKSVARFRCVSKIWSSIAADPYFLNAFETVSRRGPRLLLCFRRKDKLFVFSIPQDHENSNEPQSISSQPVDSYQMIYPKYCSFSLQRSVHGLICIRKTSKPIIWNPITRQFLILPKPEKGWKNISFFLGYDPIQGNHKLVGVPADKSSDECRVLTLRSSQESWRVIKASHEHQPTYASSYECIDGVVYYKAMMGDVAVIMSFNVRSEKSNMIKLPWKGLGGRLATYERRLACVQIDYTDYGTTLWVLENAEKQEWSSQHFSAPCNYYDRSLERDFHLIGITDGGEFVYVPSWFKTSFYILYYDTKRNSFRRVEYKGIADNEFRLNNGLGNKRLSRDHFHTFANHIDTL